MKRITLGAAVILATMLNLAAFGTDRSSRVLDLTSARGLSQGKRPLTFSQIEQLITNRTPDEVIAGEIRERGIGFELDPKTLERLRKKGAGPLTRQALSEYLARSAPTVTTTISVSPTTVNPGGRVTVSISGGPANPKDWVGLYTSSAPDTDDVGWQYLNGTQTIPATGQSSATLTFIVPQQPGTYQMRFFGNASFTRLATSQNVTVGNASSALNIPLSGCNSFTGEWEEDGTHHLTSLTVNSNGTVTGRFTNGRISGQVSGNRLYGEWISGSRSGSFRFTLSADGQRIEGAWFNANGSFGESWNAGRITLCEGTGVGGGSGSEVSTTGCNSFTGEWEEDGTHHLTSLTVNSNGTVTGSFTDGRISGRVSGNRLYGEWISGSRSGSFRFTLSADGQRIEGAWFNANGSFGASWKAARMSRCRSVGRGRKS